MRFGHGFDAHRLVSGRRLVLAGVHVPFERGALGHSDADVVAHAICDALLGACALGDLGAHFPDTDLRWKDADSMELLTACVRKVGAAGFRVVNVDATVVLERPKIAAYVAAMRDNVAKCLSIPLQCVSIKAKTTEGLGFTGDGTGVAAYAVASLEG